MHEIDLNKYEIRTDLLVDIVENIDKGIECKIDTIDKIKITDVIITDEKITNKKEGKYITIEFEDITDHNNKEKVENIFINKLKELLKITNIKEEDTCLIIGLGNDKSTPDSLGPKTIENIIVTKHLYELTNELEKGFRITSAFSPGVMGESGIETSDIIKSIVNISKADFVIVIDALASSSILRINKTIQMTNTGIHPGSGVGNKRKEISKNTINIPVIAIGIPTVVDAVTIVNDTINCMLKQVSYNKKNINKPSNKLTIPSNNYLKEEIDLSEEDKNNLMGIVGSLDEHSRKQLIYEVLSPINYNLMVTPKEIDFLISKLSSILSNGINQSLHRQINQ